ncbi:hypothetical protein [Staphylococcus shinii]|uniref:hypothetical protein n=1 Tax=Staphylococcus shinii TaxID=2912228 RepID=UPI003CF61EF0
MDGLVMFSGQGNVSLKKLKKLVESPEGQSFIEDSKFNKVFSDYLKCAITNNLNNVSYEIIATFVSNEITWRKIKKNYSISNFTAYSAGIFNILSASQVIPLNDILNFLVERIKLFELYQGNQGLYIYITKDNENAKKLRSIINNNKEVEIAIINSDKSGVIALSNDYFDKFKFTLKEKGIKSVLKFTGLSVPYHTAFLNHLISDYRMIVDKLFEKYDSEKAENYNIIFEENIFIKCEINRQLTKPINWNVISKKIIYKNYIDILDTSPNNQLKNLITKSDNHSNILTINGSEEIWKSR